MLYLIQAFGTVVMRIKRSVSNHCLWAGDGYFVAGALQVQHHEDERIITIPVDRINMFVGDLIIEDFFFRISCLQSSNGSLSSILSTLGYLSL